MILFRVLLCFSCSYAMKRIREEPFPIEDEPEPVRPHTDDPAIQPMADGTSFLDLLPFELISEFFALLVDDYPLRPNVNNPLGYLHCISKSWKAFLETGEYVARLRENPHSALHTLTKLSLAQLPIDNTYLRHLTVANPIMNEQEIFMIILNAGTVDVLRLVSQRKMEVIDQTRFTDGIWKVSSEIEFELPNFLLNDEGNSFDKAEKVFIRDCLNGDVDVSKLQSAPTHSIVKLLFFYDLYRPAEFAIYFEMVTKLACANYHAYPENRGHLAKWIRSMSKVILPRVGRNLMLECFTWPMTLAALLGDREFVQMFKADLDQVLGIHKISKAYTEILKSLQTFANGGNFVVEQVRRLEHLFNERKFLGSLSFPIDKIRMGFEQYRPQFDTYPDFLQ